MESQQIQATMFFWEHVIRFTFLFIIINHFIVDFLQATQVDNADRYTTALLRIQVQAANENPPKFEKVHYVIDLVENSPVGTPVLSVLATDNDQVSRLLSPHYMCL